MVRGPQPPPAGRPGRLCSRLLPHGCEPSASYSEPRLSRLSRLQEYQRQADLGGLEAAVRGCGAGRRWGDTHGDLPTMLGTSWSPAGLTATGSVGDDGTRKASEGKGPAQGHTVSLRQNQGATPHALAPIQGVFLLMKQVFFVLKTPLICGLFQRQRRRQKQAGRGGRDTSWQGQTQKEGVGLPWEASPCHPRGALRAEPQDARQCLVWARSRGRTGVLMGSSAGKRGDGRPRHPTQRSAPGSAWSGWGLGVLTALGLRLAQGRGQCVGFATEDSEWGGQEVCESSIVGSRALGCGLGEVQTPLWASVSF